MEMTNVLFNTETLGNGPKILAIRKKIVDLKKKENKTKKHNYHGRSTRIPTGKINETQW